MGQEPTPPAGPEPTAPPATPPPDPAPTPTPATTPPGDPSPETPPAGEPKTFDESYVKQLRTEAAGYRTKVNDLEQRLKEFEDRDKTDVQRITEERDGLKTRVPTLEGENLRLRVALKKGLTGEKAIIAERLRGNTEEELAADADELLKTFAAPAPAPAPGFDGGPRTTPQDDPNAQAGFDRMRRGFAQLYGEH